MQTSKIAFLAMSLVLFSQMASAEEKRHLGAHVHGRGTLNIAIEGNKAAIEFEAPGADIVGFENEPSTPEQKRAVDEGNAKLSDGLSLFTPPPQAGCALVHAAVSIEAHEHEHGEREHEPGEEHAGGHHSEFHAEYSLQCRSLSRLTSMTMNYFKAFPRAQALDVSVIGPKGQSSFEVTRDNPGLDLAGIM